MIHHIVNMSPLFFVTPPLPHPPASTAFLHPHPHPQLQDCEQNQRAQPRQGRESRRVVALRAPLTIMDTSGAEPAVASLRSAPVSASVSSQGPSTAVQQPSTVATSLNAETPGTTASAAMPPETEPALNASVPPPPPPQLQPHIQAHAQAQVQAQAQAQRQAARRPWWRPPPRNNRQPGTQSGNAYSTTDHGHTLISLSTSAGHLSTRLSARSESLPHYWLRAINHILRIPFREFIGNISRSSDITPSPPLADVNMNNYNQNTPAYRQFTPYIGQDASTDGHAIVPNAETTPSRTTTRSRKYIPQIRMAWRNRTSDMRCALSWALFTCFFCVSQSCDGWYPRNQTPKTPALSGEPDEKAYKEKRRALNTNNSMDFMTIVYVLFIKRAR
ncbi:hypothetical protein BC939DRAFT_238716 [Gamsiella multidivaricata]|uniref:uncharacterized protein n=1 Tax=Gamsiella multidivaricata TaxID=101098 RepID=UPI00221F3B1E|nr:uncharacterized protein BC939DRAFT_238716 [Gamsiella multidivaricata]KAI7820329.1 hypothetical protein BC939DRAFT_238716 [Gamsiella multidivaricata]